MSVRRWGGEQGDLYWFPSFFLAEHANLIRSENTRLSLNN